MPFHRAAIADPHRRHAGRGARAGSSATPADILITTPESLYLLLTSDARERAAVVDTVIIDEIHALVPTKRGAHLALSLERLGARIVRTQPLQRIGLSATQRPLEEVARFLGGAERAAAEARRKRPSAGGKTPAATARRRARPNLHDEFADDDAPSTLPARHDRRCRARRSSWSCASKCRSRTWRGSASRSTMPSGPASQGPSRTSIWSVDPSAAARVDSRAPLDADLRQQPPARRAAGRRAQRAGRRAAGALASWLAGRGAAHRDRRPAEGRARFARWSPRRRWSWASTWARSIW